MDYDLSYMSDALADNYRDKLYIWLSDTTNGERDLVEGKIIFISQRMDERGRLFREKRRRPEEINILKRK